MKMVEIVENMKTLESVETVENVESVEVVAVSCVEIFQKIHTKCRAPPSLRCFLRPGSLLCIQALL